MLGVRTEVLCRRKAGTELPVELLLFADADGRAWIFNGFIHDISERRRSAARFARPRSASAAPSRTSGSAWRCTRARRPSPARQRGALRIAGYPSGELIGKSFAEITHPDDVEAGASMRCGRS